jgi:hypothetical protein
MKVGNEDSQNAIIALSKKVIGINNCFGQAELSHNAEETHLAEATPKLSNNCGTGVTPTWNQRIIIAWLRALMPITLVS